MNEGLSPPIKKLSVYTGSSRVDAQVNNVVTNNVAQNGSHERVVQQPEPPVANLDQPHGSKPENVV